MEKIKNINKELQGINKAIDDNLIELQKYLNIANAHGVMVGTDWEVIPSTVVSNEIQNKINVLGHKSQELIRERDDKWKEFLNACDEEYKNQIDRAKQLGVPDWQIARLETACSKKSQIDIIQAVENMKIALDEYEHFMNANK